MDETKKITKTRKRQLRGNKKGNSTVTAQRIVRLMKGIEHDRKEINQANQVVQYPYIDDSRKAS